MKGGESWSNWGKSLIPQGWRKKVRFLMTNNNEIKEIKERIIFLLSSIIYNLIVKYYQFKNEKKEERPENIININKNINTKNVIDENEFNRRRCELILIINNQLKELEYRGILESDCPKEKNLNYMTTLNLCEKIIELNESLKFLLNFFQFDYQNNNDIIKLKKEFISIKENLLNL